MNRYPSLSSFVNKKKLEIKKTKPTHVISTFKTNVTNVGLVFSISSFFVNKTVQGRKSFHEKKHLLEITCF